MNSEEYKKLFETAYGLHTEGEYAEAAEKLSELLGCCINNNELLNKDAESSLLYFRGLCFRYLYKNDKAAADMKKACELYPEWLEPKLEYGYLCSLMARDAEAEKNLTEIINTNICNYSEEFHEQIESVIIKAKAYLACLYTDQGKAESAKELLSRYDY